MRQIGLNIALWSVFALLILTGGYAMLRACDFGVLPLFGYARMRGAGAGRRSRS